jgi:DNA-binding transcriptional regulator YiaG
MTIAELVVKLAFKVTGASDMEEVVSKLEHATVQSAKAAAGVDIVSAAILGMVTTAVNAGVAMQKFAIATGLSRSELQQWEHTAALGNVSATELQQTVKGIQAAAAQIALGQGNTSPWVLLGINPHSDPFAILRQLHAALQDITPERLGMARVIAQQAGISENMFQLLRQKNLPIDSLKEMYLLTDKNQQALIVLNIQWQNLLDLAGRAKNRFASELAPAFSAVVDILTRGVDMLGRFVEWLDRGGYWAQVLKTVLAGLAVGIVALGALMTGATATLGLATAAMIAFGLASASTALAIGGIAVAAGLALIAVGKLVDIAIDYKRAWDVGLGDLRAELVSPETRRAARERQDLGQFAQGPRIPYAGNQGAAVNIGGITLHVTGMPGVDGTDLGRSLAHELKKQLDIANWSKPATAR